MDKLAVLLNLCITAPGGRLVSTGDLNEHQIAEATTMDRMYVDEGGFGYVFLPWSLTTRRDRLREADYFGRNNMMV